MTDKTELEEKIEKYVTRFLTLSERIVAAEPVDRQTLMHALAIVVQAQMVLVALEIGANDVLLEENVEAGKDSIDIAQEQLVAMMKDFEAGTINTFEARVNQAIQEQRKVQPDNDDNEDTVH